MMTDILRGGKAKIFVIFVLLLARILPANGSFLGQDIHPWMFQEPNMSNPILDPKGLTLSMVYPITDYITADMVKYELYNKNCSEGGVRVEEWFTPTLVSPSVDHVSGDLDNPQMALMNITIVTDPNSFDNAPPEVADQWFSDGAQGSGRIQFCLLAQIHVRDDPSAIVDGSETLIIVDYDLTDGFTIEVDVDPDRNNQTADEDYGPTGK